MKALEFYSGIGAFHEAARGRAIEIALAFDQDERANSTYEHNFKQKPCAKNLDSIKKSEIPDADIWWLSPPCTPFSVRGRRRDLEDERTDSFKNLLALLPQSQARVVFIENVLGFENSRAHELALSVLAAQGFAVFGHSLCPTDFGVPMRRPRYYLAATRNGAQFSWKLPLCAERQSLSNYIEADFDRLLIVEQALVERYGQSLHLMKEEELSNEVAICFTRGYWKSMKASGSFIVLKNGEVRRFSPEEILALLGFSPSFAFPPNLPLRARLQLAGNSVDVRAIGHLIDCLLPQPDGFNESSNPQV